MNQCQCQLHHWNSTVRHKLARRICQRMRVPVRISMVLSPHQHHVQYAWTECFKVLHYIRTTAQLTVVTAPPPLPAPKGGDANWISVSHLTCFVTLWKQYTLKCTGERVLAHCWHDVPVSRCNKNHHVYIFAFLYLIMDDNRLIPSNLTLT